MARRAVISSPPPSPPQLFVSIFAYVLGKEATDPAARVQEEIELGEGATWPAFRTLRRIREQVWPIQLKVTHSSLIARARSLALGAFLESGAPRWISIDDDVDANAQDVGKLLVAKDVDILLAPCALRGGSSPQLNIVVDPGGARTRLIERGVRVFEIESGGFALSMMTRAGAKRLEHAYPELAFAQRDEGRGLGVFLEFIKDGAWWGEDFACCKRAHWAGCRVEALRDTAVSHAGLLVTVDPAFFSNRLGP
jgi:hypothetical protein